MLLLSALAIQIQLTVFSKFEQSNCIHSAFTLHFSRKCSIACFNYFFHKTLLEKIWIAALMIMIIMLNTQPVSFLFRIIRPHEVKLAWQLQFVKALCQADWKHVLHCEGETQAVPPSSTTEGYAHKDGQKLNISKTSSLSAPSPHLDHPLLLFIQHNRLPIYYYVQFYLQLTAQQWNWSMYKFLSVWYNAQTVCVLLIAIYTLMACSINMTTMTQI